MASFIERVTSRVEVLVLGRPQQRYRAVPEIQIDGEDGDHNAAQNGQLYPSPTRRWSVKTIMLASAILFFIVWSLVWEFSRATSCDDVLKGYTCSPHISQFWGQYSPFFSVPSDISPTIPKKCEVKQVNVLARHGARDPTKAKSEAYKVLMDQFYERVSLFNGKYAFLKSYRYRLGMDQLTELGENQMENLGTHVYRRYHSLTSSSHGVPFIRAAGQERVIHSAEHFGEGYRSARNSDKKSSHHDKEPYAILTICEHIGCNNTLSHELCDAFETGPYRRVGVDAQKVFAKTFVQAIQERLNADLPGADFTLEQTIWFMDLCPFETVAHPQGKLSPFCSLFSEKEWQAYSYYQSIGKYYGFAQGNPLGPTQGVGFTNELIARLTHTPVQDHTSTNHTLDDSEATFPLSNKTRVYADFSHDNDMMTIFAALGLFNTTKPLNKEKIEDEEKTNGFSSSWAIPFAARAYFELLECHGEKEDLVRVLVNDRVIPLQSCGADKHGMCKLSKFVESMSFAREGGHWDQCFLDTQPVDLSDLSTAALEG